MYIGLISDTHGVFSKEFRDFLEPVDQIWHAGDFGGGMELAKEIRKYDKEVQMVFLTGVSDYVFEGYEIGAMRYLLKPVQQEKLSETLNTLLEAIVKAKPAAAKGTYIKSCVVASTMGVGIPVSTTKYGV